MIGVKGNFNYATALVFIRAEAHLIKASAIQPVHAPFLQQFLIKPNKTKFDLDQFTSTMRSGAIPLRTAPLFSKTT